MRLGHVLSLLAWIFGSVKNITVASLVCLVKPNPGWDGSISPPLMWSRCLVSVMGLLVRSQAMSLIDSMLKFPVFLSREFSIMISACKVYIALIEWITCICY